MNSHTYTLIHIPKHTDMHIHTHIQMHTHIYMHTHMNMDTHIYTYTQTHAWSTGTHTPSLLILKAHQAWRWSPFPSCLHQIPLPVIKICQY